MPGNELTCPRCGSAYKASAFGGACPRCLMLAAPTGSGFARFEVMEAEAVNAALPDYEVSGIVGSGGMGAVYRARQMDLDREVALKLLSPEAGGDPEFAERFAREAKVLGRLAHPNIVPVYGIGYGSDGVPFYSMKLVKGRTLQEIILGLRSGDGETVRAWPLSALLTVFRKVCDAMAFAHSQHILHRDLKPENVMVGEFGEVLVMDWGLARMSKGESPPAGGNGICQDPAPLRAMTELSDRDIRAASFGATLQGAVLGTPQYMSPEQARGETDTLDARSDIYALGGILYSILTLRAPVEGRTLAEIMEKARSGTVLAPARRRSTPASDITNATIAAENNRGPLPHLPGYRVPAALSAVVMKALARERADRYPNVAALSADVEAWQGGFSTSAQNAGPWTEWKLFMVRHRVVTTLVALMLAVSAGFVIKVIASEHRATQNAVLASQNEQHALREKEATRQAFAQSQIAVADAAAERLDTTGLQAALAACPPDLRDSSWHYLAAKANAAIATLPIHSYGAVFRHTGQGKAGGEFLVAHMHAPVISVIEPHTGRVLREWKTALPDRKVLGLRADGTELIISSEWDQEFEILNCATGASVLHRRLASGGFLERPMLSPDGSRILTILVGPDNSRRLVAMDRSTGAILWEQPGWFYCGFSRDTAWAAVMNVASKAVAVIRTDTGEVVCNMEPGHSFLWDLRFSEDNERVAGADYEGYATVWDRASGRRLQSFRVCGGNVQAAAFTANGTLVTRGLESADRNSQRRIQIWNPARVVQLAAFLGGGTSGSNSMALDPGRGWLCTDGTETRVWQVPVQRHRQVIQCSHPAMMATFLGNEVLITQHGLSPPQMWRIGARETTPLTPDPAAGGIFSTGGDGTRVLFTDGKKDRVRLATLAGEGTVHFENPAWAMTGPCVALDPSGTRAAAGNMGDRILLFTAGQARCVRELFVPEVAVWKLVAFTGGGGRVLAAGTGSRQNDFLACWDTETGALIHLLSSVSPILALAVSPDGTRFARAGADKIIYIHHAADCRPELSFRAHDAAINGLAWHPSRPLLASVSDDLSLKLWNPGTGELLTRALGLSRSLLCAAFSADGKTLVAGTADPAILVFDTDSLEAN